MLYFFVQRIANNCSLLCFYFYKIVNERKNCRLSEIPPCSLEVDHRGIRLVDHAQENEVNLYQILFLISKMSSKIFL